MSKDLSPPALPRNVESPSCGFFTCSYFFGLWSFSLHASCK